MGVTEIGRRYMTDPLFRNLTTHMVAMLESVEATTLDLREAAFMASLIYEEKHVRPVVIPLDKPDGEC